MANNNHVKCPNCNSMHKIASLNLYEMKSERTSIASKAVRQDTNYLSTDDVAVICPNCNTGLIIDYEATNELEVVEIDAKDMFHVDEFLLAEVIYGDTLVKQSKPIVSNNFAFQNFN